jgi:hypothetical protein
MLNKKSTVHGQQVHGEIFHEKLPEKDSRNEKFLKCVNINEIEFTCNKESQRVMHESIPGVTIPPPGHPREFSR